MLFSDLHGNDAALERLLQRETGLVLSAGDVLGRSGSWTQAPEGSPFWTSVRQPTRLELALEHRYLIQIGSLGEPLAANLPTHLSWDDSWVEWHP